jgi:uncharacterized small protein (DUF1192 family)
VIGSSESLRFNILDIFQVTELERMVERLTNEMENMKIQLAEERNARQRLEAKLS